MEHAVAKSYDDDHNTLTVPCEKCNMISFTSSVMKNNNLLLLPSRFPIKSISLLLLDWHQVLVVYLNVLLSFYEIIIIYQATSCAIISLISRMFSYVFA